MKRLFGWFEAVFDALYLCIAITIGCILLSAGKPEPLRLIAGIMALVLAAGDSFHLIPRVLLITTGKDSDLQKPMGLGKQITSITMTIFYLLLMNIGLIAFQGSQLQPLPIAVYVLSAIRIILCLMPQNRWCECQTSYRWSLIRNIPFLLIGILIAYFYFINRNTIGSLSHIWVAIILSFGFYLPVVIWSNRNPKIGMLMLPKTLSYLWILASCLSL